MAGIEFDSFEQYIRDSLAHLYDFTFLQDHPLLRVLVPHANGEASRVQAFRQIVHEAIEQLRTPDSRETQTRNARLYHILTLRYLKQQPIQNILHQLNLSERQFYRDHTKALATVSRMLWDRVKTMEPAPESNSTISIQSEIRHIQSQSEPQQIQAQLFLQKTLAALRGLCDQHETSIELTISEWQMPLGADLMVLRQTLICILSQLIVQSPVRSRLSLTFETRDRQHLFIFRREGGGVIDHEWELSLTGQETLYRLVEALGGQLIEPSASADGSPDSTADADLILQIPSSQRSLLMVDDNPDAIALFRRYLAYQPYQLLTAYDGTQAIRTARQFLPELIILDVMLPQEDGWEILQNLRNCAQTRSIPVLICSVLDVSGVAISLGADGFLRKPPGESDFLNALSAFLS